MDRQSGVTQHGLVSEAGSAMTGPRPLQGAGQCARQPEARGEPPSMHPHLDHSSLFCFVKFFPSWMILGFLPRWTSILCLILLSVWVLWERGSMIWKAFPLAASKPERMSGKTRREGSGLVCIIKWSVLFLLSSCSIIVWFFFFFKGTFVATLNQENRVKIWWVAELSPYLSSPACHGRLR